MSKQQKVSRRTPIIHRRKIVVYTYSRRADSVMDEKIRFMRQNRRVLKSIFEDRRDNPKGWNTRLAAQRMATKIRKKFGYSPRTKNVDVLIIFMNLCKNQYGWS